MTAKRPKRRQKFRLNDMAGEIAAMEAALAGVDFGDFAANWLLRSAVERGIERISEASRHIDPALLAQHPDIPWRRVADVGNWLRHGYEQVDPEQIWRIVTTDFAPVKLAIAAISTLLPE